MSVEKIPPSLLSEIEIASLVVDETPAIVGYIDCHLVYRFANRAYLDWFGKSREEVMHRPMKEVLGPVYDANLPHTLAVLQGEIQIFERKFKLPNGTPRYGLVTYKPHFQAHEILGFYVLVADVSVLKKVEFELIEAREAFEASVARELTNLRQTNTTLERLGTIGKEITTHLDAQSASNALMSHIHEFLKDCSSIVYIYDAADHKLKSLQDGTSVKLTEYQSAPINPVISAFLEQRQIFISTGEESTAATPPLLMESPGTSLLVGPMIAGDNVFGVIAVHACETQLTSERIRLIFHALCAYGAIALKNANAYTALKDTQMQLLAQAKMAALGTMVAGVAHKLNTPIGNSLLMVSTLEHQAHEMQQRLADQIMRRSDLNAYLETAIMATKSIAQNLERSAELIASFKLITGSGSGELRQTINLHSLIRSSISPAGNILNDLGYSIDIDVSHDLKIRSYPDALADVLKRLVDNVIQHAFTPGFKGHIILSAQPGTHQTLQIVITDNGVGIATENLARVFDPFFTTKMGQGDGGLGLSICYNLVTNLLHGDISVHSELGVGTSFTVSLPE